MTVKVTLEYTVFSREAVIWAAGIIEGEGCLNAVKQSRVATYQLRVAVSMTDLDILERLQSTFGLGQISGPRIRGTNKPIFTWNVCNFQDAQAVMTAIYPWMGVRRREQILISLVKNAQARAHIGFCRKNLHYDIADRGTQTRGYFCKACRREGALRLQVVS